MNPRQRRNSLKYAANDPRRKEARGVKIAPEVYAEMKRLYLSGVGCQSIAVEVGLNALKVWRALKRMGVKIRPQGAKGARCIEPDCSKPTEGARRCPLHRRLRLALLNREIQRERLGVKSPYYADSDWHGTHGEESSGVRLFIKRSEPYGPTVVQLETQR